MKKLYRHLGIGIIMAGMFFVLLPYCKASAMELASSAIIAREADRQDVMNVDYRTKDEIREYIKKNAATLVDEVTYKTKPSIKSPFNAGRLSDKTLKSALNMVNQIRFIAGISHQVTLDEGYTELVQAGTLVNAVNNELSHLPVQPSGMSKKLFDKGYQGTSSSNLGSGYRTLNTAILYGWMADDDSYNIDRVGHRRWVLNPSMNATGFGATDTYYAMYVFNRNNSSEQRTGVAWPAQTMPTEYFREDFPWSISMGYRLDENKVKVTLTRLNDNKVWTFQKGKADGYFNINNDGYGQSGCIIFRPDDIDGFADGEQFRVEISGLESPLSYVVEFFDLISVENISVDTTKLSLQLNDNQKLKVTVLPANASNKSLKYSSSAPSVVRVSEDGRVNAVGYGTAVITVTSKSGNKKAVCTITVKPEKQKPYYEALKSNQVTIVYQKESTKAQYEIIYATNASFTKNKKVLSVTNGNTIRKTITRLKSKTTYYVKMRSYVNVNGKKIYGPYSDVLKFKTN